MASFQLSLHVIIARSMWLAFSLTISSTELTTSSSQSLPGTPTTTLLPTSTPYEFDLSSNSVVVTSGPVQVFPTDDILVTPTTATSDPSKTSNPGYRYRPLFQNETFHSDAFVIDTTVNYDINPLFHICWYPISGNYCRMPRILFYVTIVAALLLREHVWLYTGALAASLTYSGTAAIHACLLIWHGFAWGELDLIPLLAILTSSCLIMVPLLNWSSILRHPQRGKQEIRSRTDQASQNPGATTSITSDASSDIQVAEATRLVLVCWSFLVFVGLTCLVLAITSRLSIRRDHYLYPLYNVWTPSIPSKIICAPAGGKLNLTVGQGNVQSGFSRFQLSAEFLSENKCLNSCGTPTTGGVIFRGNEDLVPLPFFTNNPLMDNTGDSNSLPFNARLQESFINGGALIMFFIVAQGICAILSGPRSPAEVRALIYRFLTRVKFRGRPKSAASKSRQCLVKYLALFFYAYSIATTLASIPIFVLAILAAESFLQHLPQNETEMHVGAWSPWANTGLILIAAIISRFHTQICRLTRLEFWVRRKSTPKPRIVIHTLWKAIFVRPWDSISDKACEIKGSIRNEWEETKSFWKDPECSSTACETASEASKGEQNEGTGLPSINRLSNISMSKFGLPRLTTEEDREDLGGNGFSVHSNSSHPSV